MRRVRARSGLEFGRLDGDFALGFVEAEGFQVGGGILEDRGGLQLAEPGEKVGDFADVGAAFGVADRLPEVVFGCATSPFLAPKEKVSPWPCRVEGKDVRSRTLGRP